MTRLVLAIATVLCVGSPAWATTFDAESGTGYVEPPDVQLPFGWTDLQFQERAPGVAFGYQSGGHYTAVCRWATQQGGVAELRHSQAYVWEAPVNSVLRYDPRQARRIAGFQLLGFANSIGAAASLPAVGAPCAGPGGVIGAWSVVTSQVQTRTLSARFAGVEVLLPF